MFESENKQLEEFYKKKSDLQQRLQKDVIRNGTAYLSCKVGGSVGSGILLGAIKIFVDEIALEFFYVLFWLFADVRVLRTMVSGEWV